jgi:hypothetical protein
MCIVQICNFCTCVHGHKMSENNPSKFIVSTTTRDILATVSNIIVFSVHFNHNLISTFFPGVWFGIPHCGLEDSTSVHHENHTVNPVHASLSFRKIMSFARKFYIRPCGPYYFWRELITAQDIIQPKNTRQSAGDLAVHPDSYM